MKPFVPLGASGFILKQKSMNAEQNEADLLLRKGYTFNVTTTYSRRWYEFWRNKKKIDEKKITIAEPTLATLDLLSSYWIDFAEIDADKLTAEQAKRIMSDNSTKCAKVVAVVVLGNEAFKDNGRPRYKRIDKLARTLMHSIKPSVLLQIAKAITACSNIADFMLSIRLLSAARTTARTNLIE